MVKCDLCNESHGAIYSCIYCAFDIIWFICHSLCQNSLLSLTESWNLASYNA